MKDATTVVPSEAELSTGVRDTQGIAAGLADILADTYRLTFKTHAYHWNVEGPLFYSLHKLTEAQYENMFAAADQLAERIRALGHLAPLSMADIVARSQISDLPGVPSAGEMIADLVSDHERVAHRLHALVQLVEGRRDPVTEDLATERSAFHEQAAWMLRAMAKS
ncbi:Dps family protein [Tropicibacter oceani]|uniref:DNA starvation/stationary phase protection protein n=1 Tax=Tropicibacter oceani TaxID=3058420 RepID=A0ABY8QLR3_9RHOB|nr:DNA starvation/stationary phase protection protein [Tropicibacter oceani]WGW05576.1 DNA starvation/stationary phase protection protein [Tropicibacter oceani]